MIRVVPVDNQAVTWAESRVLSEEHGDIAVAGRATGDRKAVVVAAHEHPGVACTDLWMPIGDGLTTTRQIIASHWGGSPVMLVVTTFDLNADVFGALEAGADGFILRGCGPEGLVGAIRRLAVGHELVDRTVTHRVTAEFTRRHVPTGNTTEIRKLMARESEIAKLLATGMSDAETTAKPMVEASTAKPHLARILPKIGAKNRVQMMVWAHCNGPAG